ncbi:hypothetical protein Ccrd_025618 [Cynara cardunculus var. scolymus]|uniref:Uncharacterized protein n=1 Tax=Cynara cardunculus var. scolymus TaxID=59895 RepID=A0A118JSN5_CYNCS|nr:hypothetical protein Ccrd_025618 [Cynara cardunculus var. scolymus]
MFLHVHTKQGLPGWLLIVPEQGACRLVSCFSLHLPKLIDRGACRLLSCFSLHLPKLINRGGYHKKVLRFNSYRL